MCFLRYAALAVTNQSDTQETVVARTIKFFLAQCLPKIRSRFDEVKNAYLGDIVTSISWAKSVKITLPTCETCPIRKHTCLCEFMMKWIPCKDLGEDVKFLLTSSSFPSWIEMILTLLNSLAEAFPKIPGNLDKLSGALQNLHHVIDCAPPQLWTIPEFNEHLRRLRSCMYRYLTEMFYWLIFCIAVANKTREGEDDEGEKLEDALQTQTSG
jgi:hypothetical protein